MVPSLLSGAGIGFILGAILSNNQVIQDVLVVIGAVMLWFDFFVTMAIIRYSLRSLDRRIEALETRRESPGDDDPRS